MPLLIPPRDGLHDGRNHRSGQDDFKVDDRDVDALIAVGWQKPGKSTPKIDAEKIRKRAPKKGDAKETTDVRNS